MKSLLFIIFLLLFSFPALSETQDQLKFIGPGVNTAQSGCCSWHGGVCGCNFGRVTCCDGTASPSCSCLKEKGQSEIQLYQCEDNGLLAQGYHYVNPYVRSDGTYVQGHYQTNPDGTTLNNWSTKGNVNPFTGSEGTRNPYPSYNSNYLNNNQWNNNSFGSSGGSEE